MVSVSHFAPLLVTVIADNSQTVAELQTYLQSVGVVPRTARTLLEASELMPETAAVVLFPDDFEVTAATRGIAALRAGRPEVLLVVVTSAPQRFGPSLEPDGHSRLPIVLPKPAFGWAIVDAIRGSAGISQ